MAKQAPRAEHVGRPDFVELEKQQRIQHTKTRGYDANPNPVIGTDADGNPIQRGHAKNPDFPAWRAGLNPEKYHAMTLQYEEQKKRGSETDDFRPELEPEEQADYEKWLKEKK